MKKATLITIVILALLFSMLPVSTAFAAKPIPQTQVTVYNHTKGNVEMVLTDFNGFHYFYSFANSGENIYTLEVPQGKYYDYYIVTHCETHVGNWNLTRNRFVDLYCSNDISTTYFFRGGRRLNPN